MMKSNFIKAMSIRSKLVSIILIVTLFSLLLGAIIVGIWGVKREKAKIVSNLLLNTKLVSENCIIPLSFSDSSRANIILSTLKNISSVELGILINEKGEYFASFPLNTNADLGFTSDEKGVTWNWGKNFIEINQPIIYGKLFLGTLFIKANTQELKSLKASYAGLFLFILSLLLMVTFFLAQKLQSIISKPILELGGHFKSIAQTQDFSVKLTKKTNDETGDLFDNFNELLNEIRNRNQEKDLAEEIARESERRFAEVMKSVSLVSIILDTDGNISYCNDYFLKVTGYQKEEVLGKNWFDTFIPDSISNMIKEVFNNAVTDGEFVTYLENEILTKDGEIKTIAWNNTILKDSNLKITGVAGLGDDITERKQSELKIRESEERFRTIFERSASGMCLTELDGKLLKVNNPLCEMLEYASEELEGKHFNSITYPEDLEIGIENVKQMLSGKTKQAVFEKRYLKKSGELIWVHINSTLLKDSEGKNTYFITQMEDITHRITADNLLKSSEIKYRALVEQSLTGIYIFEKDKFNYVNGRFCEIFGYTEEEILSSLKPTDVVMPEEKETANENIEKRLTGEIDSIRYTAKGKHKKGIPLWVEIHGTHITYEGKHVITGTVLDITERKKTEEEIIKLNEELEQKVIDRTKELESKYLEVERLNKLFIGRELRMIELKDKIKLLEEKLNDN